MRQYLQFDEAVNGFLYNNSNNKVCYLLKNLADYGTDSNNFQKDPALYLSVAQSDATKVSFITSSKVGVSETWNADKRTMCKPGKIIRRILKENFLKEVNVTNKDIEDFANIYRANFYTSDIKEVKGEDIRKFYYEDNYHKGTDKGTYKGTLWESCMRHSSCYGDNYMQIYSYNPDKCTMLCVFDSENKVMARALLWHNVYVSGDETKYYTIMDRIYFYHEYMVEIFKKYAKKKGYLHKYTQGHSCDSFVSPDGTSMSKSFIIQLKKKEYCYYPYMDTFYHYDADKGVLSNQYYGSSIELREVDGHAADQVECYVSGDMIHRDEARYVDGRDIYVYEDYAYEIEYSGEYALEDDVVWIANKDWYAMIEDTCEDEIDGDYIMNDESCELFDGQYTHMDNVYNYEGLNYLANTLHYSESEGEELPEELACYINKRIGWMLKEKCTFVKGVNGNKDKWLPYNEDTLDL